MVDTEPVIDLTNPRSKLKISALKSFYVENPDAGNSGLSYRWECNNGM
jgi:hypothetical protein